MTGTEWKIKVPIFKDMTILKQAGKDRMINALAVAAGLISGKPAAFK